MKAVLAYPVRAHILATTFYRPIAPADLYEECKLSSRKASYHLRVLEKCGYIRASKRVTSNGAHEHIYSSTGHTLFNDPDLTELQLSTKGGAAAATLHEFVGDAMGAIRSGRLNGEDAGIMVWEKKTLDDTGRDDALEALEEARGRLREIERESAQRLSRMRGRGRGAGARARRVKMSFGLAAYRAPIPTSRPK